MPTLRIDRRELHVTNLRKVMHPATGTTRVDLIGYYRDLAAVVLPYLAGRPITREQWPTAVQAPLLFTKDADAGTPEWVRRVQVQHSGRLRFHPVIEPRPTWPGSVRSRPNQSATD